MAKCAVICEVILILLIVPYATSFQHLYRSHFRPLYLPLIPTTTTTTTSAMTPNILLKELGSISDHLNLTEENHYQPKTCLKVCLKDVTYIRHYSETDKLDTWREYEVEFVLPCEKVNSSKTNKIYKQYSVVTEQNRKVSLNFEVIAREEDYILSKYEEMECRNGTLLSKSYHNWTKEGKEQIIVKLKDLEEETLAGLVGDNKASEEGVDRILPYLDLSNEKAETSFNNTTDLSSTLQPIVGVTRIVTTTIPTITAVKDNEQYPKLNDNIEPNKLIKTDMLGVLENSDSFESKENRTDDAVPALNPCSPVLTQLLAGNGLLPGLCNLRRDEKIVLQGDIVVTKRYKEGPNSTDIIKPLFVIHENTEIERPN